MCTRRFLIGKVDLLHVHNMPDFLVFAAIIPRLFKKKLILDIHDSMPETYSAKFDRLISISFKILCMEESLSATLSHKVIYVNHVQKEILMSRRIPERINLVSMNIPDPKRFTITGRRSFHAQDQHTFKMIYQGTIAKRLGVDLVIKAVTVLKDILPHLEF